MPTPVNLAKASTGNPANTIMHPFGLWFANATTLHVADEGDGVLANAGTANSPFGGLQKWTLTNGTWNLVYTLTTGLNIGQGYAVAGDPNNPATDGLRHIAGTVNGDGTVTIFATTSTVSGATEPGADPNKLVAISDVLANTSGTVAAGEQFTTLETATYGEVLRGVSLAPTAAVPEPSSVALLVLAGGAWFGVRRLRRKRR